MSACRLVCLYVCVSVIVVAGSALYQRQQQQQQQVIQAVQRLYFAVSVLSGSTDRAVRAALRDGAGRRKNVC